MATITHATVATGTDAGTGEIHKAQWNADHVGGGLTVKDEGVALATDATSIDFVGTGVVASGTGVAKTITINGGGSGVGDKLYLFSNFR